jgi:hypothetical protein
MNAVRDSSVLDKVLIHSATALRYACTRWSLWTEIDTVVPLAEEVGLLVHYNFPPVKQEYITDDVHNPSWLMLQHDVMIRIENVRNNAW